MEVFRQFRNVIGNLAGRFLLGDVDAVGQGQGWQPVEEEQDGYVPAPRAIPVFRGRRKTSDWSVILQQDVRLETYRPGGNRRSLRVRRPVCYQA